MENKKIKVAIIGCGVVGSRRKNLVEKNKSYSLVAISDIKFKKKKVIKKKVIFYEFFSNHTNFSQGIRKKFKRSKYVFLNSLIENSKKQSLPQQSSL